jgi:hypothetical protein
VTVTGVQTCALPISPVGRGAPTVQVAKEQRLLLRCSQLLEIEGEILLGAPLRSAFIPSSVRVIGQSAFGKCKSLRVVTFEPDSRLRTIKGRAFSGTGLQRFEAPKSLVAIRRGGGGVSELSGFIIL